MRMPGSASAPDAGLQGFTAADLTLHLPAASCPLLLVAPAREGLDELVQAGYDVTCIALPPPDGRLDLAAVRGRRFPGVLLLLPPLDHVPEAWLYELREHCGDDGRLVVAGGSALLHPLTRVLYEARYAVLKNRQAEGGLLLVARPAHHRVRPYREGDEGAILDLFERAFHQRRSLRRWQWIYRSNPYGNERISLAEDEEGRLLAHYGGYPVVLWTDLVEGEQRLPCVHIGDTMTAPDARRVGRGRTSLITRTAQHFFATWSHGRTVINYGSNTGKVQRFSRRSAQGRRVESMPFRVRDLERPLDAPGPLSARLGGWRVERIRAFDERWDELWRRCRGAYRFLAERDARFLRWRYAWPDAEYFPWAVFRRRRLVGWSVFRQEGERLVWGDALFDPAEPAAPALLLSRVLAAPEHRGSRRVEGWFTPRPAWWAAAVERLGFRAEPEPQDLGLIYASYLFEPGDLMERHLYYTMADFDLF